MHPSGKLGSVRTCSDCPGASTSASQTPEAAVLRAPAPSRPTAALRGRRVAHAGTRRSETLRSPPERSLRDAGHSPLTSPQPPVSASRVVALQGPPAAGGKRTRPSGLRKDSFARRLPASGSSAGAHSSPFSVAWRPLQVFVGVDGNEMHPPPVAWTAMH